MSQRKSSTHYIATLIRHARRLELDAERIIAETLGDLYRKGERISSYLAPQSASLRLLCEGDTVSVLPIAYIGESDPDHFLIELMTVLWHRFPCWAIDENIPLQLAFFSFDQPEHGLFYEEIFD